MSSAHDSGQRMTKSLQEMASSFLDLLKVKFVNFSDKFKTLKTCLVFSRRQL